MAPQLVDHLQYEKEDNGILWIKFNRPESMNALYGTAEAAGTVAKVGEYMRARRRSRCPRDCTDRRWPRFLLGR
jgi:1,4-dihydroxy-2-naphthoyl-CoA synthase